ncbi:MAG: hypothetical protein HY820_31250 [Acidobacteria bacterium]|nr:hypothetical protein [Acidobacteriota bacterium]
MRRLTALLLLSLALAAADLTGIWTGQIPTRNNDFQDVAFQITQKGTTLSGKLYGDYRSMPIVEGKVETTPDGEKVTFVVLAQEQAGNQINETRLRYTGTMRDGVLELTREREASTNAGNGGGTQTRVTTNQPKQTLKLKRLI